VEVNIDVVEVLLELNYLDVVDVHDLTAVASAVTRFVEDSAGAVTCNGITLNSW